MRRFETTVAIATATALVLSGCGGEDTAPNQLQPTAMEICTPGYDNDYNGSDTLPTDGMLTDYYYEKPGADLGLAKQQISVGSTAVSAGLTHNYCVKVDRTDYAVSLRIPDSVDARAHRVVFIANSKHAGEKFDEMSLHITGSQDVSGTKYTVRGAPLDNHLVRQGQAVSVVGQEKDGGRLWHNIATERCQGLDMVAEPMLIANRHEELYTAIKEAVCNALGRATSRALLGVPYSQYMADNPGVKLLPPLNNSGHDITYPIIPQRQYEILSAALHNISLQAKA